MIRKYVLDDDGQPREVDDTLEWAQWYEENVRTTCVLRHSRWTTLRGGRDILVSTIFLAIAFDGAALFETMVFAEGLDCNEHQWRWPTRETALSAHAELVDRMLSDPEFAPQPLEIEAHDAAQALACDDGVRGGGTGGDGDRRVGRVQDPAPDLVGESADAEDPRDSADDQPHA